MSAITTGFSGTNPSLSIVTTTVGYPKWDVESAVNQTNGLLGLTLLDEGAPDTNPVSGSSSLVLLTFNISQLAAVGSTPIYLAQTATPTGIQVATSLTAGNSNYSMPPRPSLTEPPTPTNNTPTNFVTGVDGSVNITADARHFVVTAASAETAGTAVVFTCRGRGYV